MFEVELYSDVNGNEPVASFIDGLNVKMAAKLVGLLQLLGEKGTELRLPYSEHIRNGIFELRCKQGTDIVRAMYFFYVGKRIVVTNGFIKKTQTQLASYASIPRFPPRERLFPQIRFFL